MVTSLVSALLRVPVRRDVAMTGEITLRGRVLAIGGVKDKILAAHRADVFRVLIPAENLKDLKDVPEPVLAQMSIVGVEHVDEVLRAALALAQPGEFLPGPSITVDWRKSVVPAAAPEREDSARSKHQTHPPTLNADSE
jgi:ATP-dependent Lon protease